MTTLFDESARRVLDMLAAAGRPSYESLTPKQARQTYREGRFAVSPETPAVAQVTNTIAATANGPLPMRIYREEGVDTISAPALVFYHGGGWVFGDLDTHDVVCRTIARAARIVVMSIDYRLAPEHAYPAAVEDAYASFQWIVTHARDLGIDLSRLAVGGDSAGGNLAAVVSLMARDADVTLAGQMLIYPVTDLSREHPSYSEVANVPLTGNTMRWFKRHYLGDTDAHDWRISPLLADSLEGLPPAFVMTAGHDPLRDEGDAYALRLQEAGVPVRHVRYSGQIHGFITMGRLIPEAGQLLEDASQWLEQTLSQEVKPRARVV